MSALNNIMPKPNIYNLWLYMEPAQSHQTQTEYLLQIIIFITIYPIYFYIALPLKIKAQSMRIELFMIQFDMNFALIK